MTLRDGSSRRIDPAMDRHADGDPRAFREVHEVLRPRLYQFFVRRTGDQVKSEDLVQETFLRMHAARASFRRGADVATWAFTIARRLLIDTVYRAPRETSVVLREDDGQLTDHLAERASAPDEVLVACETACRLDEALAALPHLHRSAYELVRLQGLSVAEAALRLGTTRTAVKLRTHRAHTALRHAMFADDRSAA